jgi:hypothetical protein
MTFLLAAACELTAANLCSAKPLAGPISAALDLSPKVGSTARPIWTPRVVQENSQCACNSGACSLNGAARRIFRRPRLMKIEVAEMTGDVNNLADEIKPGHGP